MRQAAEMGGLVSCKSEAWKIDIFTIDKIWSSRNPMQVNINLISVLNAIQRENIHLITSPRTQQPHLTMEYMGLS